MARTRQLNPTTRRLVAVEGREEVLFFNALVRDLGLGGIEVWNYDGTSQLRGWLGALVRTPGFRKLDSLLLTRDADENPDGAVQSLCDAAVHAGLEPRRDLGQMGTGQPRVCLYVMPGNRRPGTLEHLCLNSVAEEPVMTCVNAFFDCVGTAGQAPRATRLEKAKVYAYLAALPEPGRRLGEAAVAGTWPFDSPVFEGLIECLQAP